MAEIIDLDLLVPEDIPFKIGGQIYKVPTSLNTQTVLKLMKLETSFKDVKEVEDSIKLQDEMVFVLLSQLNEITEEWIAGLGQTQKSAIIQHYKTRMNEINSNPNFKSLPSQTQE